MRIGRDDDLHLTYCTNIHPGNGWREVEANLRRHVPALRADLAPEADFGIGLRLSAEESAELLRADALERFREFLAANGLYVFTLNGFPYGSFHGQVIKSAVFAPDWRSPERLDYTRRLVTILAALLPEGMEGGISTVPLSYKPWLEEAPESEREVLIRHLVAAVVAMHRAREESGRFIHLDLEPEPWGLVETSREIVAFFERYLLPLGLPMLALALGLSQGEAERVLREHLQICWDTCHLAIEYEDPSDVLRRLQGSGIGIGKLQISAALQVALPPGDRAPLQDRLTAFADSTYLHQVIARQVDGTLVAYPDLDVALEHLHDPFAREWRIHYHVPLFVERYGLLGSSRPDILRVFELLQAERFTRHLEIETYTWDLLPPGLKHELGASIAAEYRWVLEHLDPSRLATRRPASVLEGSSHA